MNVIQSAEIKRRLIVKGIVPDPEEKFMTTIFFDPITLRYWGWWFDASPELREEGFPVDELEMFALAQKCIENPPKLWEPWALDTHNRVALVEKLLAKDG